MTGTGYAKNWVFTLNNYTQDEQAHLRSLYMPGGPIYLVFGRETASTGTPHLQGFVSFGTRKRLGQVKAAISDRIYAAPARGTPTQAAEYCKKEGDFEEFGTPPPNKGHRSDIDHFKSWVMEYHADTGDRPSECEVAIEHSALWLRYPERLMSLLDMLLPPPILVDGALNPWQDELWREIDAGAFDDRKIKFIVDREGGKGKSWFCRYVISKMPRHAQMLSIGKRDDLAHAVNCSCKVFLFNIPRGQMEYLQYAVLEQMKDQTIFSPKYNSQTKILTHAPFIAVFSNEDPDLDKMTADRYDIKQL